MEYRVWTSDGWVEVTHSGRLSVGALEGIADARKWDWFVVPRGTAPMREVGRCRIIQGGEWIDVQDKAPCPRRPTARESLAAAGLRLIQGGRQ